MEKIMSVKRGFLKYWLIWVVLIFIFRKFIWGTLSPFLFIFAVIVLPIITSWITNKLMIFFFGCKICNSTGKLSGEDEILEIEFNDDECYACQGKGVIIPSRNEWYKFALEAAKMIRFHQRKVEELDRQINLYEKEVKISGGIEDGNIIERKDTQLGNLKGQLDFETAQIDHHNVIRDKAHLILHKKNINRLQNKWQKIIISNGKDGFDNFSNSIIVGEGIKVCELLDTEVDYLSDYLDSVVSHEHINDLIADVKKATEKLKVELANERLL